MQKKVPGRFPTSATGESKSVHDTISSLMLPKDKLSIYFFLTRKPGQVAIKFLRILTGTSLIAALVICGGSILAVSVASVKDFDGLARLLRISVATFQSGVWNIVALSLVTGVTRASVITYRDWQAFIPCDSDKR